MSPSPRREKLLKAVRAEGFDPSLPSARFEVAGTCVKFLTGWPPLLDEVRSYFSVYATAQEPHVEVCARHSPEPSLWVDEDPEFHVLGEAVVQRDFAARRLGRERGALAERAVALVGPGNSDAVHNLLRWVLPRVLLSRGSILLYGAGVVRDGRGYVFLGQSGAGKSTVAALIADGDPEAQVLGDDAVIVSFPEGEKTPSLHAAPLGCGYSRVAPPRVSAPLAGIYALHQSSFTRVTPLPPSEGAAALVGSAMCPAFDDGATERLELAGRFARAGHGVRRLDFTRDSGFWSLIRGGGNDATG